MKKSILVTTKKRRGRPPTTGKGTQVGERWHEPELKAIDRWIEGQGAEMSRGQAIRRLVEIGLNARAKRSAAPSDGVRAARAAHLAERTIDRLAEDLGGVVAAALADEKAKRKRRLTKRPQEFRADRKNQPNAEIGLKAKGR